MKALSLFLVSLLAIDSIHAQEAGLRLRVIAGQGARSKVNQSDSVDPVVEVDDDRGRPVEGASVQFTLPQQGPSGRFDNGSKTMTVTTDARGRATAPGIRVNRLKGNFQIQVAATYQGRSATAAIAQTNISRNPQSRGWFGFTTKQWVVAGLVVAAIAGGILAAKELRGGNNGNVVTATPGTPTVGGPQ